MHALTLKNSYPRFNWNCLKDSIWTYQHIVGIVSKPTKTFEEYVLKRVNNWRKLVLVENYTKIFGPGDEYDKDPLATALLGNKHIGITSIRCGPQDIVLKEDALVLNTILVICIFIKLKKKIQNGSGL